MNGPKARTETAQGWVPEPSGAGQVIRLWGYREVQEKMALAWTRQRPGRKGLHRSQRCCELEELGDPEQGKVTPCPGVHRSR